MKLCQYVSYMSIDICKCLRLQVSNFGIDYLDVSALLDPWHLPYKMLLSLPAMTCFKSRQLNAANDLILFMIQATLSLLLLLFMFQPSS